MSQKSCNILVTWSTIRQLRMLFADDVKMTNHTELWHYEGGAPSRRSFCLFWRETKQRPGLEISDETGSGVGKAGPRETRRSWKKEPRGRSWQRATERGSWESTRDSRRDQSAWDRVQQQWGKTSQDELAFLVALWKFREGCTSALVYRCTKECRVSQLNLLALELIQTHIVRLFFALFSHSLDCISCSHREMCDTPIGTTRWFTGLDWNGLTKLMYSGGRGGIVTELWDAKLAWYSPRATRRICLYDFGHSLGIHTFRPTWSCLIVKVLTT